MGCTLGKEIQSSLGASISEGGRDRYVHRTSGAMAGVVMNVGLESGGCEFLPGSATY